MPKKYYIATTDKGIPYRAFFVIKEQKYDVYSGLYQEIKSQVTGKQNTRCKSFEIKKESDLIACFEKSSSGNNDLTVYDSVSQKTFTLNPSQKIEEEASDSFGRTKLHLSARAGDIETIRALVGEKKSDINAQDSKGYTPLHYAISYGRVDAASTLIELGAREDIAAHENRGNYKLPIQLLVYIEDGTPLLLNKKTLDSETKQTLSELFSTAYYYGITLNLAKDSSGYYRIIKNLNIPRQKLLDDVKFKFEKDNPDYQANNMEIRHRISAAWVSRQFEMSLIGMDYREAFKLLVEVFGDLAHSKREINTQTVTCLIGRCIQSYESNMSNLFLGDKTTNAVKGWLINELNIRIKNKTRFPFAINVPTSYQSWFNQSNECGICQYFRSQNNTLYVSNNFEFLQLYQLAVIDDETKTEEQSSKSSGVGDSIAVLIGKIGQFSETMTHAKKRKRELREEVEAEKGQNKIPLLDIEERPLKQQKIEIIQQSSSPEILSEYQTQEHKDLYKDEEPEEEEFQPASYYPN